MSNFQTTSTPMDVKAAGYEDVQYTIRLVTEEVKMAIHFDVVEFLDQVDQLREDQEELYNGIYHGHPDKTPAELLVSDLITRERNAIARSQRQIDVLERWKINPVFLRHALAELKGLDIDGSPATAENWNQWPPAVYEEVVTEIKKLYGMSPAQQENLGSPITSGAEADGQNLSTSAQTVSEPAQILDGSADDIGI